MSVETQLEAIPITETLLEETSSQLLRSTWPRIKARVRLQNINAKYMGMRSNGDLLFVTNSGTTLGKMWHCRVRFMKLEDAQELYKGSILFRRQRIMKMLLNGDIQVSCDCHCWRYYFKYTAWINGYGLMTETRPAKIRNPHNDKSLCKHLVASLLLLSNNFDEVYKDMKEKGFFKDKKKPTRRK